MSQEHSRKTKVKSALNLKQEKYVENLFTYTNELFRRTESRANYLFVGNSIIAAAFFSIVRLMVSQSSVEAPLQNDLIASCSVIIPAIFIGASVLITIRAILPIILDAEIQLNQSFIAKMSNKEYRSFVLNRNSEKLSFDFIDEIHILSQILDIKNSRLRFAMNFFIVCFLMIFTGLAVLAYRISTIATLT